MFKEYDYIIIGAGIYGLYAAKLLVKNKLKIAVIEDDSESFQRASYINQARVHNGYHYPRSYSTALKTAEYFNRFVKDFNFAINSKFKQIYAISKKFSFTTGNQFQEFCSKVNIPCIEVNPKEYFNTTMVDKVFETTEYAFDPLKIRDYFIEEFKTFRNINVFYNSKLIDVESKNGQYLLKLKNGDIFITPAVLNATYASINQIIDIFHFEMFEIKYEIAEIILCNVTDNIKNVGITVMDGPFFSLMPFGFSNLHSLTSVTFTPHLTSYNRLPHFNCQKINQLCLPSSLENCNLCPARPKTAWPYMHQLAKKYLIPSIQVNYKKSLFSIKPILMASELDDSRPTIIKKFSENPTFISVLSGKINTIFDLDGELL